MTQSLSNSTTITAATAGEWNRLTCEQAIPFDVLRGCTKDDILQGSVMWHIQCASELVEVRFRGPVVGITDGIEWPRESHRIFVPVSFTSVQYDRLGADFLNITIDEAASLLTDFVDPALRLANDGIIPFDVVHDSAFMDSLLGRTHGGCERRLKPEWLSTVIDRLKEFGSQIGTGLLSYQNKFWGRYERISQCRALHHDLEIMELPTLLHECNEHLERLSSAIWTEVEAYKSIGSALSNVTLSEAFNLAMPPSAVPRTTIGHLKPSLEKTGMRKGSTKGRAEAVAEIFLNENPMASLRMLARHLEMQGLPKSPGYAAKLKAWKNRNKIRTSSAEPAEETISKLAKEQAVDDRRKRVPGRYAKS